jgi:hypothetical protein
VVASIRRQRTGPAVLSKYEALMWPTLEAIKSAGGSATIQEILDTVVGE